MGRIIVRIEVANPFDGDESIRCRRLVDTGAGALTLPTAWKERFGNFRHSEPIELQLANQEVVRGEACGPARAGAAGRVRVASALPAPAASRRRGGPVEPSPYAGAEGRSSSHPARVVRTILPMWVPESMRA